MKKWPLLILLFSWQSLSSQDTENILQLRETDRIILTHSLVPAGPVPTAFDPDGVYPYVSFCETANRPQAVKYRIIEMENRFLKAAVCPDLGGKVISLVHKKSGKETLYSPEVIRPVRILPRFYFVAGGIEVSFPISHSPTQNEAVLYDICETPDRIYLTCGERELRFGMQWSVEYSLGSRDSFITQRVIFHNPGRIACPWMSWSNAALPSAPDTRFYFPEGKVLSHSSFIDTIDWKTMGPKTEKDICEMTGYFWIEKNINAFGAFTPSLGSGLFHVADEGSAPGIKLWSYGTGADSSWAILSTASKKPYIEIQGGPISNQSIKLELQPGETRTHTEFWIPGDRPLDISLLKVPSVNLRTEKSIPLFGWARPWNVNPWISLEEAFRSNDQIPEPPEWQENCWPPSGMEDLAPAFKWAVAGSGDSLKNIWNFYYGAWLAGRSDTLAAIRILAESSLGVSRALQARLLFHMGQYPEAAELYRKIEEPWIQLHPQVIVERDRCFRKLDINTSLQEREYWLQRADALNDEWVIERRVQLLIDKAEVEKARDLLLSTVFQKVHQTYNRTALWFQICDRLGNSRYPIPESLGEDRLAGFGAYREFE